MRKTIIQIYRNRVSTLIFKPIKRANLSTALNTNQVNDETIRTITLQNITFQSSNHSCNKIPVTSKVGVAWNEEQWFIITGDIEHYTLWGTSRGNTYSAGGAWNIAKNLNKFALYLRGGLNFGEFHSWKNLGVGIDCTHNNWIIHIDYSYRWKEDDFRDEYDTSIGMTKIKN